MISSMKTVAKVIFIHSITGFEWTYMLKRDARDPRPQRYVQQQCSMIHKNLNEKNERGGRVRLHRLIYFT